MMIKKEILKTLQKDVYKIGSTTVTFAALFSSERWVEIAIILPSIHSTQLVCFNKTEEEKKGTTLFHFLVNKSLLNSPEK